MPPTLANGEVCYIEIPARDIRLSADFYARVFGWRIRQRGDGHTAFDDTTGEVSGTWVAGRPASSEPGLLIYVIVDRTTGGAGRAFWHHTFTALPSLPTC
ncbi:MAG: VOC family protein [Acidobacteriota bacterium]|nr:VOC family protein [Acidobacteriota bacterium]